MTTDPLSPQAPSSTFDPYELGRRAVERLKVAEGGSLSHHEAAARLALTLTDLREMLKQRKVVAWTDSNGYPRFPVWQFGPEGVLPGVGACLETLGRTDEWAVMRFFLTPNPSEGDKTALECLRAGDIQIALAMANRSSVHP